MTCCFSKKCGKWFLLAFTKLTSQAINPGLSGFFCFFLPRKIYKKSPFYTIFLGSRYHQKKGGDISRCGGFAWLFLFPSLERTALKMKKPTTSLTRHLKRRLYRCRVKKPEFEALFFSKKTTLTSVLYKKDSHQWFLNAFVVGGFLSDCQNST